MITSNSMIAKRHAQAAVISTSSKATQALGFSFAQLFKKCRVLLLCGDLGSGKTCFVHGLARGLGVAAGVRSPTYTLINEYSLPGGGKLYHLDCYRTDAKDFLLQETIAELLENERNLLVVEWGERLPAQLSLPHWRIDLAYLGEDERRLCYTSNVCPRSSAWIEQ